jgi:ketosteroid isomerase-like protein
MPHWLRVALVFVAFGTGVAAQMAEQEVAKAEQARIEGRRKADSAVLARFSSDDILIVGPSGQLIDKKGATALPAVPKINTREVKTQIFGDVAVVTGIQAGVGPNGDQEQRFTRVWRKQNGQWTNAFGQVTLITPTGAPNDPATANKQVQPTKWPEGKTQDERDVLRTQRMLNELYAKKDAAGYAQLTADTFIRITNGAATRTEFLKAVAGTPDLKRVESNNSDFHFRSYGPIAVLAYIDKAVGAPPQGFRMTRIYVKQNGARKQLVTQYTPNTPQ